MRFIEDKDLLTYLTPPITLEWKGVPNGISGAMTMTFDVSTWGDSGEINISADVDPHAARIIRDRMYQHARALASRFVLPDAVTKKLAKYPRRGSIDAASQ